MVREHVDARDVSGPLALVGRSKGAWWAGSCCATWTPPARSTPASPRSAPSSTRASPTAALWRGPPAWWSTPAQRISAGGGVTGIAVETYGRPDVMCHVGGSSPEEDLDLLRLDIEHDDQVMDLDARSTVVGSRLALPHTIEGGGGSIIDTASVGGLSEDYLQVGCGTVEAAVIRLTQHIAEDRRSLLPDDPTG